MKAPALSASDGVRHQLRDSALAGLRSSGATVTTVAPRTALPVGEVPLSTPCDIAEAFAEARSVQEEWGALPPRRRTRLCAALRRQSSLNQPALHEVVYLESGVRPDDLAREMRHLRRVLRRCVRSGAAELYLRRCPVRGVAGVITPWTYPLTYAAADIVAMLMAGNGVVQQVDAQRALTAVVVRDLAERAGVPRGLWQIVTAPTSAMPAATPTAMPAAMAEYADHLRYVGPREGARRVAELAALWLRPMVIDASGLNPVVVLDDADPGRTAATVAQACLVRAGQSCITPRHVHVEAGVYDRFAPALAAAMDQLGVRPGGVGALDLPSLASTLEEHVSAIIGAGAHLLTAGAGASPTLLAMPDGPPVTVPVPGPVITISRLGSGQNIAAVGVRRDLHAAIYTRDRARGQALARLLPAYAVSINPKCPVTPAWQPHLP